MPEPSIATDSRGSVRFCDNAPPAQKIVNNKPIRCRIEIDLFYRTPLTSRSNNLDSDSAAGKAVQYCSRDRKGHHCTGITNGSPLIETGEETPPIWMDTGYVPAGRFGTMKLIWNSPTNGVSPA